METSNVTLRRLKTFLKFLENKFALKKDLNTNGYGEFAGGKNLFNGLFITPLISKDKDYTNIDLTEDANCRTSKSCVGSTFWTFGGFFKKGTYTFSYTNDAYFSLNRIAIAGTACKVAAGLIRKSYTWTQNIDGYTYFGIEGDKSVGDGTDTPFSKTPDIQIEEGDTSTSYEPYFLSNKMLMEENTHQSTEMMDIKMLGWSVPRNCPIQNEVKDNQFIQKVGRVDLGTLYWNIADNNKGFVSFGHAVIKSHGNMFCHKYGNGLDKTWSDNNIGCENKTIWVADTSYSDVSAFKIAMQGVYLYYELATPVTTTIDGNEINLSSDTVLTGKLNVGETVLSLKSEKISDNSIIDVYTDTYGLIPTSIVQSENSIILTFKPQSSDANIKVVIR